MGEKVSRFMAAEKRFQIMADMVSLVTEAFRSGYYHAMSDMEVMNSNEQIQEACEAAFIRWGLEELEDGS